MKIQLNEFQRKILKIAAEICWMHGSVAGDRVCQDWTGNEELLDALTAEERDQLQWWYEQWNSNGKDYEQGYYPYDEMVVSFHVARVLELMAEKDET